MIHEKYFPENYGEKLCVNPQRGLSINYPGNFCRARSGVGHNGFFKFKGGDHGKELITAQGAPDVQKVGGRRLPQRPL